MVKDDVHRIDAEGKLVATGQEYYQNSAFVVVVKFINLCIATAFLIVSMALELCCKDRML